MVAINGSLEAALQKVPRVRMSCLPTPLMPLHNLERALGCLVDGKVYVLVTRGEKPTAGYGASIEELRLVKSKDGSNLKVHALFSEPEEGEAVSQIVTYPYCVAETELESLPDTIELIVKYED